MKENRLRKLIVPLLVGGALIVTALPGLASGGSRDRHDVRHYNPPAHAYGYSDRNRGGKSDHYRGRGHDDRRDRGYDDRRSRGSGYQHGRFDHPKYASRGPHGVVHHYYYTPAPRYSPPPRVFYSYDPAVVIRFPPIIFR